MEYSRNIRLIPRNVELETAMPRKGETKQDAFVRLVNNRMPRVLEQLRLIAQLSSRSYEHTEEQANEVMKVLKEGFEEVAQAYEMPISIAIGSDEVAYAQMTNHVVTAKTNDPDFNITVSMAAALENLKNDDVDAARGILKKALLT